MEQSNTIALLTRDQINLDLNFYCNVLYTALLYSLTGINKAYLKKNSERCKVKEYLHSCDRIFHVSSVRVNIVTKYVYKHQLMVFVQNSSSFVCSFELTSRKKGSLVDGGSRLFRNISTSAGTHGIASKHKTFLIRLQNSRFVT